VSEGLLSCPRCGRAIPAAYEAVGLDESMDVRAAADDWGAPFTESDAGIDDPELLEQVEAYVKELADLPYQPRGRLHPGDSGREGDLVQEPTPLRSNTPQADDQACADQRQLDELDDDLIYDPELLEQAEAYVLATTALCSPYTIDPMALMIRR
jgi:hypothetical protein